MTTSCPHPHTLAIVPTGDHQPVVLIQCPVCGAVEQEGPSDVERAAQVWAEFAHEPVEVRL